MYIWLILIPTLITFDLLLFIVMGNCGDKVQKNYRSPHAAPTQSQFTNSQIQRIYLTK